MENKKKFAVVLGSGLNPDGTATPVTEIRARAAAELARRVKLDELICSGFRAPQDNETEHTEASRMAEIIKAEFAKDAPKDTGTPALRIEDKSMDTIGNAVFTIELFLEKEQPGHLIVVTSPFHMERSIFLFSRLLKAGWTIEGSPCQEWSGETRQSGAQAAMERAKDFFSDIEQGDLKTARKKLMQRKPYSNQKAA